LLTPKLVRKFKKDYKKAQKSGKNIKKLEKIMEDLCAERPLTAKNKDHQLYQNWAGYRECHIEPNWLLIYRYEPGEVIFVRTGSHSELFT
jgi:mRNA interferase YafQ